MNCYRVCPSEVSIYCSTYPVRFLLCSAKFCSIVFFNSLIILNELTVAFSMLSLILLSSNNSISPNCG